MHSSTTEAVRLPPDEENGLVTVHPALRSKLPLKRKVRDGKLKRKHKGKESNNNIFSPKKSKSSPKKKKRVAPIVEGEEAKKKTGDSSVEKKTISDSLVAEPPKGKKTVQGNKKKKKVIDYSGKQVEGDGNKGLIGGEVVHAPLTPEADPVGKVQNWLLKSQYALPKSKSTPAGFPDKGHRSPHKRAVIKPKSEKSKSHSVANLPTDKEKVRLQVVYKPPFKFSVKLRKPDKLNTVVPKRADKPRTARTGVLVRTVREPVQKSAPVKPGTVTTPAQPANVDNIDSNTHTVQSDLEVLLSESEFLFSDD